MIVSHTIPEINQLINDNAQSALILATDPPPTPPTRSGLFGQYNKQLSSCGAKNNYCITQCVIGVAKTGGKVRTLHFLAECHEIMIQPGKNDAACQTQTIMA